MTTQELLKTKLELNEKTMTTSQALTNYCKPYKGDMGLVSDECRNSETYKKLKFEYNTAFNELRTFNKANAKNKELQKAIREEIDQRRINNLKKKVQNNAS